MSDPDFDLERLSKRPAPEPRPSVAMLAKRDALAAFDEAMKKTSAAPQGSERASRLSHVATKLWSHMMNTKFLSGTAIATLMIAPIAGITAYQLMLTRDGGPALVRPSWIAKKDIGTKAVQPVDNKVVANDEEISLAQPKAEPVKPVEVARKRAEGADAAKAKSEVDAIASAETRSDAGRLNGGSAANSCPGENGDGCSGTRASRAKALRCHERHGGLLPIRLLALPRRKP